MRQSWILLWVTHDMIPRFEESKILCRARLNDGEPPWSQYSGGIPFS